MKQTFHVPVNIWNYTFCIVFSSSYRIPRIFLGEQKLLLFQITYYVLWTECLCPQLQTSHMETLTFNVIVFRGGDFGR